MAIILGSGAISKFHGITDLVKQSLEEERRKSPSASGLAQALDKVLHGESKCKLGTLLPRQYSEILNIHERFKVKSKGNFTKNK